MIAITKVLFERPMGYNPRIEGAFTTGGKMSFDQARKVRQNQSNEIMKKFRERMKARKAQGTAI